MLEVEPVDQQFNLYLVATVLYGEEDKRKVAILLSLITGNNHCKSSIHLMWKTMSSSMVIWSNCSMTILHQEKT